MKKIFILSALLTLSICANVFANDICSVNGYHRPGTYEYNGATTCDLVQLPMIIVHGSLMITGSMITGETQVSGPLYSSGTVFSDITIFSNYFHDKIYLNNHSIVKNDITFVSNIPGKVYVDSTSQVEGRINNGTIINH